jgi:hypothetical protein
VRSDSGRKRLSHGDRRGISVHANPSATEHRRPRVGVGQRHERMKRAHRMAGLTERVQFGLRIRSPTRVQHHGPVLEVEQTTQRGREVSIAHRDEHDVSRSQGIAAANEIDSDTGGAERVGDRATSTPGPEDSDPQGLLMRGSQPQQISG